MSLIKVDNIRKEYGQDKDSLTVALDGVSFSIDSGEFVAVMGPSGSGKSTLLHILGFLDRQSAGQYFFDEKSIDDYTDDQLAFIRNKKMGFVFQAFNLLPRVTVLENVKLPLVYSGIKENLWDDIAINAIKAVGLQHRANHDTAHLSGGEKQRVAIARALVNKPQVIFADEPTGNLDTKSGQAIMEILQDLNEKAGHTIILITHETTTAQNARRIIRIIDGAIESDQKVARQLRADKEYLK